MWCSASPLSTLHMACCTLLMPSLPIDWAFLKCRECVEKWLWYDQIKMALIYNTLIMAALCCTWLPHDSLFFARQFFHHLSCQQLQGSISHVQPPWFDAVTNPKKQLLKMGFTGFNWAPTLLRHLAWNPGPAWPSIFIKSKDLRLPLLNISEDTVYCR